MSLRPENTQVALGRRIAQRGIVMRNMKAIPAYVLSRKVLPLGDSTNTNNRDNDTWGGLGTVAAIDQHAIDYTRKGHAIVRILDSLGGNFHESGNLVLPEDFNSIAYIEPYDIELDQTARIREVPEWEIEKNDLICLLMDGYKQYHECVGIMGQAMLASAGKRYMLAARFDLRSLDSLKEDEIPEVKEPYA